MKDQECPHPTKDFEQEIRTMNVTGTNKIRGILQLPVIKKQVARDSTIYLTENEFYTQEVQSALKMGYIQSQAETKSTHKNRDENENSTYENELVLCQSCSKRPIMIPVLNLEIRPGSQFRLKTSDLHSAHIKAAISKGWIKVIGSSSDDNYSEGNLSIMDKVFSENSRTNDGQRTLSDFLKEKLPAPTIANNTEISHLKTIEKVPVTPDSNDPRKNTIIFNPTGQQLIASKTSHHSVDYADPENFIHKKDNSPQLDPIKNTIIFNATKSAPEVVNLGSMNQNREIVFADERESQIKRANHPVLSKTAEVIQDEVLLDMEAQLDAKIAKHPVLGKIISTENTVQENTDVEQPQ